MGAIQKSLSLNKKILTNSLEKVQKNGPADRKRKYRKSNRTRQKNKRGNSKVESTDSPEIPDRGETWHLRPHLGEIVRVWRTRTRESIKKINGHFRTHILCLIYLVYSLLHGGKSSLIPPFFLLFFITKSVYCQAMARRNGNPKVILPGPLIYDRKLVPA